MDLAKAGANALEWDIEVPGDRIKARVENGIITLEGLRMRALRPRSARR